MSPLRHSLCVCLLILTNCAVKSPSKNPPRAARPDTQQIRKLSSETTGPIDDCLMHSYLYSRENSISSECTLNYIHYFPKENFSAGVNVDKKYVPDPTRVRIGSYNLFHLGDNVAPMKSISLMAAIINRWDIVGVQELMPLPAEWSVNNQQIFNIISTAKGAAAFPHENWEVVKPGYFNLLLELQKLDPSWALILQSEPEGEGSTGEMAGFFYRSRFASLKEWDYCTASNSADIKSKSAARNLACLLKVRPGQRNLISRTAFAAYFQVGNFDFVGLTAHVRFSPDQNLKNITEQTKYVCTDHATPAKCKIPRDQAGRYYEMKLVADQISDFEAAAKDKDIIYMADTNVEMNPRTEALWAATLKPAAGYAVYQPSKTTLSVPGNKLVSNYDHFILSNRVSSECDTGSIKSYDYWTPASLTEVRHEQAGDPVIGAINTFLRDDSQKKMLATAHEQHARLIKVQTARQGLGLRVLTPKEQAQMSSSCTRAVTRMKKNKTGALMELLSDHLPIEMNCRINGRDDD